MDQEARVPSWARAAGVVAIGLLINGICILVGRSTALAPGEPAVVWPAASSAFLLLLAQPSLDWRALVVVLLAVENVVLQTMADAGVRLALAATTATIAQSLIALVLLTRWCPGLLATDGRRRAQEPSVLMRALASLAIATALGAWIGVLGRPTTLPGDQIPIFWVEWWGRNLVGLLILGGLALLMWERWLERPRPLLRISRTRLPEGLALVLFSITIYWLVFAIGVLPIAFAVVSLTLWVASRFSTLATATHTAVFGALAVALSLNGHSVFRVIDDPDVEILATEVLLLTLVVIGFAVSMSRDARDSLTADLLLSQQETASRAELLGAMTDALGEGIVVVRADGTLAFTNPAAETMLPTSLGDTDRPVQERGWSICTADGVELAPEDFPSRRALREGHVPHTDLLITGPNGERIVSVTARALSPSPTSVDRLALAVMRDVTEERGQVNLVTRFAETVAHDLRSPLTTVTGWLDVVESSVQEPGGRIDRQLVDAVHRAQRGASSMGRLIEDLLSQAKAEGSVIHPEPLCLAGPTGLVLDVARELAPGLDVVTEELPPVAADRDMTRQLLANLIQNSVKYVADGVAPQLSVSGLQRGNRVQVRVTDNGIGIPPDQRLAVFSRFHRAHQHLPQYSGTGLGLAICRTIVERHGGVISCEPAQGHPTGTTFVFDLSAVS